MSHYFLLKHSTGNDKCALGYYDKTNKILCGICQGSTYVDFNNCALESIRDPGVPDNVDPFRLYSDEEIWNALEKVQMKPKWSAYRLNEPIDFQNLTSIERQLLFLAVAVLKRPAVIIIKECEDIENIKEVTKMHSVIDSAFKDATIIFLTVRKDTIKICENIFFFDKGKLLEEGKPLNLIKDSSSKLYHLLRNEDYRIRRRNKLMDLLIRKNAILSDETIKEAMNSDLSSLFDDNSSGDTNEINYEEIANDIANNFFNEDCENKLPPLYSRAKALGLLKDCMKNVKHLNSCGETNPGEAGDSALSKLFITKDEIANKKSLACGESNKNSKIAIVEDELIKGVSKRTKKSNKVSVGTETKEKAKPVKVKTETSDSLIGSGECSSKKLTMSATELHRHTEKLNEIHKEKDEMFRIKDDFFELTNLKNRNKQKSFNTKHKIEKSGLNLGDTENSDMSTSKSKPKTYNLNENEITKTKSALKLDQMNFLESAYSEDIDDDSDEFERELGCDITEFYANDRIENELENNIDFDAESKIVHEVKTKPDSRKVKDKHKNIEVDYKSNDKKDKLKNYSLVAKSVTDIVKKIKHKDDVGKEIDGNESIYKETEKASDITKVSKLKNKIKKHLLTEGTAVSGIKKSNIDLTSKIVKPFGDEINREAKVKNEQHFITPSVVQPAISLTKYPKETIDVNESIDKLVKMRNRSSSSIQNSVMKCEENSNDNLKSLSDKIKKVTKSKLNLETDIFADKDKIVHHLIEMDATSAKIKESGLSLSRKVNSLSKTNK